MQPEHLVLCGGLQRARVSGANTHRLNLTQPGQNIVLRITDIVRTLVTNLPDVLIDLLELAAYVYCADGMVPRGGTTMAQMGRHWRRKFRFVMPVRLPELWSSAAVSQVLIETLSFLSDDFYEFEFQLMLDPPGFQSYLDLSGGEPHGFRPDEIVLFSGGLDSLAGVIQELTEHERCVALVSHRSAPKIASRQIELVEALRQRFGRHRLLYVPVWVKKDQAVGKEFTHRSRSFLYTALGFVVSRLFGPSRVRIFENGIVSLNLPLIPHVLGARASRTTHPQVISGFSRLFSALVPESFTVQNPFLWKTKSEILRMIAEHGCAEFISQTVSCARVREMTVLHTHCGVCSQCVDRRFAVLAAGLETHDPETSYKIDLLVGALPAGEARTMVEAYVRAASEIERMNDVAFFSRFGEASRAVRFLPEGANDAGRKIYDLYKRHAIEVCGVVDNGIRENASALRAHTLPAGSLLVLALPRREDADTFVSSKPLKDFAEQEFDDEVEAARLTPAIRIAFDDESRRVIFDAWPPLSGASYSLLNQLRAEYEQAKLAGTAPENYPFVNSHKLAQRLDVDEPTVRRRISRLRHRLDKHSVAAGNGPLSPDAVIENEAWAGYRLNPAVLVLAVSELSPTDGVTSSK
jgi:7-cyano-7-deazaguanine synthase in queuosine biosynthesis